MSDNNSLEYDKSYAAYSAANPGPPDLSHESDATENLIHEANRLQLNTYQSFIRNVMNPSTDLRSLLLVHMTGTGKTITALAAATEYVKQYQPIAENSSVSSVVVLGFTKDIFKKELLAHPEFKFVSYEEARELKDLEQQFHRSDAIAEKYHNRRKKYLRRLVRRDINGIYQFYGYREFVNKVLNMEDLAAAIKKHRSSQSMDADPRLLKKWIADGSVRVNTSFIRSLSSSLFICDEVHNLYKGGLLNTYGIGIQLVFDYFFKTLTPGDREFGSVRSLLLSATPLTSSAAEVIQIIALLTRVEPKSSDLFKT